MYITISFLGPRIGETYCIPIKMKELDSLTVFTRQSMETSKLSLQNFQTLHTACWFYILKALLFETNLSSLKVFFILFLDHRLWHMFLCIIKGTHWGLFENYMYEIRRFSNVIYFIIMLFGNSLSLFKLDWP